MANYRDKQDYEKLNQYSASIAVDRHISNLGSQQLDYAVSDAKKAEEYLDREILLKKQLSEILKQSAKTGITKEIKSEILRIQNELKNLHAPTHHNYEKVETQEVMHNYSDMIKSNAEFAQKYDIDLSNPFMALFSNVEREIISSELSEKFDLLRLDKYDYAFASAVGIIGGIVDAVFVGTATNKLENRSALNKFTDESFDKMVKKYAEINGWKGPKGNSDPVKSAIGFLEREFPVNYDARLSKDVANAVKGMTPSNHHLLSMDHSPFGLVCAIFDLLQGKATFYDPVEKGFVRVVTEKLTGDDAVSGIAEAVKRWFGHLMSDVSGSSGSVSRGAGIPTGMQGVLQSFQFGKIPIGNGKSDAVYGTIGDAVQKMFENGYDLRFSAAASIPVIVCEILIRIYWFCKQHFYYGKSFKDSIPIGNSRELQRLLLITSFCFSTIDVAHAIVKGYSEQNPITFLNSLNYIQLANLGYKLFVNFRLEHEHNEQIKELMKTEVDSKFNELINADYSFSY